MFGHNYYFSIGNINEVVEPENLRNSRLLFVQYYAMKTIFLSLAFLLSIQVSAQNTKLPHGTVYGKKPDSTAMVNAAQLQTYMAQKPRISTTIKGRVTEVTKSEGGWFNIDATGGKVIAVHFKDYAIKIPTELKGHTVMVEGVAQKQADPSEKQHFAGKKQPDDKTTNKLSFEATGLMVD